MPIGERLLKGIGSEALAEVVWICELARVSDASDQMTLILTEKGTVVVELAKDAKQDVRDAMEHLQRSRAEEDGAITAFLQRGVARFAKRLIGLPFSALRIAREQDVAHLTFSLRGSLLTIRSGDGSFVLKGVDPEKAKRFVARARDVAVSKQGAAES